MFLRGLGVTLFYLPFHLQCLSQGESPDRLLLDKYKCSLNEWVDEWSYVIIVIQSLSCVRLLVTPWTAAQQASLSFTISQSLLKLMPIAQWCHPTLSSSVIPFLSCLQSFPASGSFPMSQLFASDDQNIGASASASILTINIQCWFPLGLTFKLLKYLLRD